MFQAIDLNSLQPTNVVKSEQNLVDDLDFTDVLADFTQIKDKSNLNVSLSLQQNEGDNLVEEDELSVTEQNQDQQEDQDLLQNANTNNGQLLNNDLADTKHHLNVITPIVPTEQTDIKFNLEQITEQNQELNLISNAQIEPQLNIANLIIHNQIDAHNSQVSTNLIVENIAHLAPTPQILPTNLGQKIINLVNNEQDNAYLELQPANLGKLEIKLNVQQHQLQIALNCDNSQVKNFLTAQISTLQQVLAPSFGNINVQVEANLPQQSSHQNHQHQTSTNFNPPVNLPQNDAPKDENLPTSLQSSRLISYYV